MKRMTSLLLTVAVFLGIFTCGAAAATLSFRDVEQGMYYAQPVAWAVEQGITNGTGNNQFSPNATCNRAQVVTFLWRAAGKPAPRGAHNPFRDVKPDAYYYTAVLWAVERGITDGTSATTFSPDAACNRAQVATFLHRYHGQPASTGNGSGFSDVAANQYYYNAVRWAVEQGITNGTGNGKFSPDGPCTRGQIVTFLYRAVFASNTEVDADTALLGDWSAVWAAIGDVEGDLPAGLITLSFSADQTGRMTTEDSTVAYRWSYVKADAEGDLIYELTADGETGTLVYSVDDDSLTLGFADREMYVLFTRT